MHIVVTKYFVIREKFYDEFLSKSKDTKTMHLLYLTPAAKSKSLEF